MNENDLINWTRRKLTIFQNGKQNADRETVKPRSTMFSILTSFVAGTNEFSGVDDPN